MKDNTDVVFQFRFLSIYNNHVNTIKFHKSKIVLNKKGKKVSLMENLVSLVNILMTAFTTIIVAVIGAYQKKKSKETSEYRKLKEENERLQQEKENAWRDDQDTRLKRIENSISTLTGEVTNLKDGKHFEAIESQLSQIHTLNQVNFEYMQSISNVVTLVGDAVAESNIINDHDKRKLDKELNEHKDKEEDITKKLYKIII